MSLTLHGRVRVAGTGVDTGRKHHLDVLLLGLEDGGKRRKGSHGRIGRKVLGCLRLLQLLVNDFLDVDLSLPIARLVLVVLVDCVCFSC